MTHDVEEVLPRAVALSWGVAEHPQRGPKRELSVERIVEAAMEIADVEGLAAVSMSRVASSLGFTTMSLYRYVTSKDDLLLLMQEEACGLPIPPETAETGWRDGLRQWALAQLKVMRLHPWYPDIPISGMPLTPNNLSVVDWGLRTLRDVPFTDTEKMSAILLVSSYMLAMGRVIRDVAAARVAIGEPAELSAEAAARLTETLTELVTEERFPSLAPVVRAGTYVGSDGGDIDDTEFGLDRILDGIAPLIDERARAGTGTPADAGTPDESSTAADRKKARADETAADYPTDKAVREAAKARREAESKLREALKREREAIGRARERAQKDAERASKS
jgi:AcrR family transcriptional regulator